jgi:subtilase family serine protease
VKGPFRLAALLVLTLAAAACNAGTSSIPGASGAAGVNQTIERQAALSGYPACPGERVDQMQCDVIVENTNVGPNVAGWTPQDLETAYHLPSSSKGSGQTVAIVDAYDNPNVASDLTEYRKNFGLPTAKFTKYNQEGQTKNYPSGSVGWGVEIDLDVQMASSSCPNCKIILIEADNNNGSSLYAGEKEAVKLGAHIVSNSWGGGGGSPSGGAFDHTGVTYLASAGDGGYGMQDPADYPTVVSVGGTVLEQSGTTYTEIVWPQSGGGCSVVAKPSWQHDPKCTKRTGNDISAVASGVAEYDTYGYPGWFTVGGTSVSSPLMAGVFGLAGNATKQDGGKNFWTMKKKKRAKDLHYIKSGTVQHCPPSLDGTYLCTAGTDEYGTYSGPTGWGSPNGIGAF